MQGELRNINKMLLSLDPEMRTLGRLMVEKLPSTTDKLSKIVVYLNSNNKYLLFKGAQLFLQYPRSILELTKLLQTLNEEGYSDGTKVAIDLIMENYKRVKKLQSFFSHVDLVSEILTKEPVSISKFD